MRTLILALWIMAAPAIVGAYTFESSVDPINFFEKYYHVSIRAFSEHQAVVILKSENAIPKFAINFVQTTNVSMRVLAYAYLEKGELKQYVLVGSVYKLNNTPPDVKANLTGLLEALYEAEKIEKDSEEGKESNPKPGSYHKRDRSDC